MTRCARAFRHHQHTFVDDHRVDHSCDGNRQAPIRLAELLELRPELVEVGTAARATAIGVSAA